jgi:hypothetical protein
VVAKTTATAMAKVIATTAALPPEPGPDHPAPGYTGSVPEPLRPHSP